jgi:hypothetical protein
MAILRSVLDGANLVDMRHSCVTHPGNFAGTAPGIDLTKPLTAEQVSAIEAGRDRYAVLVFRDQPLTDEHGVRWTLIKGIAFTAEQAPAIAAE